ncbi:MAG: hypothetical protein JXB26_09190 [Candidatus Aminicenantes bacterium]|nr:hypothetical protein [Candidatus Aminicenantes bacterium]
MKNKPAASVFFLIPPALILGFFLLILRQAPSRTIFEHGFPLTVIPFLIFSLSALAFLMLVWWFSGRFFSRFYASPLSKEWAYDILTYTPILFFLLTPFVLSRYLDREDLINRLGILAGAVFFAVLYLKGTRLLVLEKKTGILSKAASRFFSRPLRQKVKILFLSAFILFNAASALICLSGVTVSGDEPHYLLITHSLIKDGDFDLENNYNGRDYRAYMPEETRIDPHLAPGAKGQYSFHSPGTSLLMLPFYLIGSLFGKSLMVWFVRLGMSLFGTLLGIQIYLFALQEWKREKTALLLWFIFSFTSPVLFYSIHIYPEIIVALLSMYVFRKVRFSPSFSPGLLMILGAALSVMIWFHALKYIFIMGPLFLYSLWVFLRKHRLGWKSAWFFGTPALILAVYFIFQVSLYGSFSLTSVSWRGVISSRESMEYLKILLTGIPFRFRWETLAGYFLDQRDGLLLYAPVYFFSLLGAVEMIKRKFRFFLLLFFITAPYILNSAFLTQRTGYAPQARPLVAVCWGLAVPLGFFLVYGAKKVFRLLFSLAVATSLAVSVLLIRIPLALYQLTTVGETQRAGLLFLNLSNLHFYLPKYLPSFLKIEDSRWPANFIWIGALVFFTVAYATVKKHRFTLPYAAHGLIAAGLLLLVFFWLVLYPRPVLLSPVRTVFPTGEKMTFYSLGHVARMPRPGTFILPQDNRSYVFFFTSWREIKSFQIRFGSSAGDYDVRVGYFDAVLFQGRTSKEIKTLYLAGPPSYKLKSTNLYQVNIHLERKSAISTFQNPYHFSVIPQ